MKKISCVAFLLQVWKEITLREDRLVERIGPDKGGYWKVLSKASDSI